MFILIDFSNRKISQMFGSQATALFEEVPAVVLTPSEMSEVSVGALGEIIAFRAVILVLVFWCFSFASELDLFSMDKVAPTTAAACIGQVLNTALGSCLGSESQLLDGGRGDPIVIPVRRCLMPPDSECFGVCN